MTDELVDRERSSTAGGERLSRFVRAVRRRIESPAWLARATAVGLCVVSLAFVLGLLAAIAVGGELVLVTVPVPLQALLALPYAVAVLAAGTVAGAGWAWWTRSLSLTARLHLTTLALLGVAFTWQLSVLGLLPP